MGFISEAFTGGGEPADLLAAGFGYVAFNPRQGRASGHAPMLWGIVGPGTSRAAGAVSHRGISHREMAPTQKRLP